MTVREAWIETLRRMGYSEEFINESVRQAASFIGHELSDANVREGREEEMIAYFTEKLKSTPVDTAVEALQKRVQKN